MEIIHDLEQLERVLREERILERFETGGLPFRLVRYRKGELLCTPLAPMKDLLFLVRGTIKVYGLREDGTALSISLGDRPRATGDPVLLGNIEFAQPGAPSFFTEALEDLLCVALPLETHREALTRDRKFLQLIVRSLSETVMDLTLMGHGAQPLEERVLTFLREIQPDHCLHGVTAGERKFRCSRRQLQRVVFKLCRQGVLEKTWRGEYRLVALPADTHAE